MLESTGAIAVAGCGAPPVEIPGLSTSVVTTEGSLLRVDFEAVAHEACTVVFGRDENHAGGRVALELDGSIVARRDVAYDTSWTTDSVGFYRRAHVALQWLSPPMPAGPHPIRVLLEYYFPPNDCYDQSACIGSSPEDEGRRARVVVTEIRR
jgi:hypothetical protein